MTRNGARILGGVAGVLIALTWLLWQATRPPQCSGAVFVELRPPLKAPGPYRFTLIPEGTAPCTFEVDLPPTGVVDTSACGMALDLTVRGRAHQATIAELSVGTSPAELQLRVERAGEVIYDTTLRPSYAEFPALRGDNPRFCGQRAHVAPACLRGSSQCAPFHPACRGPGDCASREVCCVSPEQARQYGVDAAARCTSRGDCEAAYGMLACRSDVDCPGRAPCDDQRFRTEYEPRVTVCRER